MKDKREIVIAPTIYKFETFGDFAGEFKLGERDVVLTNEFIYKPFMAELGLKSQFVFQEKFGAGEPSEAMIETMYEAIPYDSYDRVIAVGGGAIMDLCKLLGCKRPASVHELYFKREPVVHEKKSSRSGPPAAPVRSHQHFGRHRQGQGR
ncbi:MAG: iron-containing alcohol dehydrogenase [Oscillospiraceae bacterium]